MGIEIRGPKGSGGVTPGTTAEFDFDYPVYAYALGIASFTLSYGQHTDHFVQDLSLRLLPMPAPPEAQVGNQVQAKVEASLNDASGHSISLSDSLVWPVCVAITRQADAKTTMSAVTGVPDGQQSRPVTLPGNGLFSVLSAPLSGFTLGYSKNDHQVLGANAGSSISNDLSEGYVTASASLYDASGNRADTANVDASVIASINPAPGFAVIPVTAQQESLITVDFSGTYQSLSAAVCLLNSWEVKFHHAHNVQSISVGAWGTKIQGNTVTLDGLWAHISDHTGHIQEDAASSATVLVVAAP